jgi:hypothetical protein
MSTGTHRKPDEGIRIPGVPWAYVITGTVLFILAVSLAVVASWLTAPVYAHASTSYLKPAVAAAYKLAPLVGNIGDIPS